MNKEGIIAAGIWCVDVSFKIQNWPLEGKTSIIKNDIQIVLVGPEIPLINGISDYIKNDPETSHVSIIGPSKYGAQLERW